MMTVTVILGDDGYVQTGPDLPETMKSLTFEADQLVHLVGGGSDRMPARHLKIYHVIAPCCLAYDGKTLVPVHERGEG
jgi:hypothetical protein